MAGRSDIRAGRAFVELYVKNSGLVKGLASAKRMFSSFAGGITALGQGMMRVGVLAIQAGAVIGSAFLYPIKAAGDLMETTSKFEAVFGESAAKIKEWGDEYAKQVGRSQSDTMAALSTFQAFFSGLGVGGEEAAEFSKQLTSLSVDFASFHNLSDAEAMQRFISALSGSGEVLSMFGVNIMQAALDQKLLQMGFKKSTSGATELQKVMARMAIIKESMGRQGAVGDAIKTAGSFSNQMKKLSGEIQNTAEAIGGALLPIVTPLVTKLASGASKVAEWAKDNHALIVSIAKVAAGLVAAGAALVAVGAGLVTVGTLASSLMAVGGAVATVVSGLAAMAPLFVALGAGVVAIASIAGTLYQLGIQVKFTGEMFGWLGEQFTRLKEASVAWLKPLLSDFQTTWSAITAAIAGGNLEAAAEVAWAGMSLVWQRGVNQVNKLWTDAKWFFVQTWTEAQSIVSKSFVSMWASIQRSAVELISFLKTSWANYKSWSVNKLADMYEASAEQGWRSKEERQKFREMAKSMREDANATFQADTSGIDANRDAERARIDKDERDTLAALDADKARAEAARNRQYEKDIAAGTAKLTEAERRLEEVRARNQTALQLARTGGINSAGTKPTDPPSIGGAGAGMAKDAFSTFSAAALQAMGGRSSSPQKIAGEQLRLQKEADAILKGMLKAIHESNGASKELAKTAEKHYRLDQANKLVFTA